MASRNRTGPLLAPGNEAEWAEINREEAEQLRALNMALTPAQRLAQGQKLSQPGGIAAKRLREGRPCP